AEAALYLEEVGARVTLAMRRAGYERDPVTGKPEIKWWVRDPLLALTNAGRIAVRFRTRVVAIGATDATLESDDGLRQLVPCDAVFALLGTIPDLSILIGAGVRIAADGV